MYSIKMAEFNSSKSYKSKDGWEYSKPEDTETYNEQLSTAIKTTLENWKEKGYRRYKKDLANLPNTGYRMCYIDNKNRVRIGGYVIQNNTDKKYFRLLGVGGRKFSVQYAYITDGDKFTGAYVKPNSVVKAREEQANRDKKRVRETRRVKNQKVSKEEAKKLKQIVKDAETDELKAKALVRADEVKKTKWTKLLKQYYYKKQYTYGRDRLHKVLKADGYDVSRSFVGKWLKTQELYQLTKPSKKSKEGFISIPKAPFNVCQLDLTEYGGKLLFNFIDTFSRFAYSYIIPNKESGTMVSHIRKVVNDVEKKHKNKINLLKTDNGSEFKNKAFMSYCSNSGIKQLFGTPYNPKGQAIIERFNRTVKDMINKQDLEGKELDTRLLNVLVKNYNKTPSAVSNISPIDVLKNDDNQVEKQLKAIQKHGGVEINVMDETFNKGDTVRISLSVGKQEKIQGKTKRIKWSKDTYVIWKVSKPRKIKTNPTKYYLKDDTGEKVKGVFKNTELQLANVVLNKDKVKFVMTVKDVVKIDKSKKPYRYYVSFVGKNASFNKWFTRKELLDEFGYRV